MPTISVFYGIIVQMFWSDHALYGEFEVLINIETLEVMEGKMPKRALALLLEWAAQHRSELKEDWKLCETRQPLHKIAPLE